MYYSMRMATLPFLLIAAVTGPTNAAVLVPVAAVQNSTVTTAFAINESDIIAGSFIGSSSESEAVSLGCDGLR